MSSMTHLPVAPPNFIIESESDLPLLTFPLTACPGSDPSAPPPPQVLCSLGNTMALLRRCRVNAALTIQLFSQLFHYVNMGVFNLLVMPGPVNYCSRSVQRTGRARW